MLIDTSDLRRAQFDRLRYEIFQNLFLRSMNTGFLRLAVATALTVYGIETSFYFPPKMNTINLVATALTVYGIETCVLIFISPLY